MARLRVHSIYSIAFATIFALAPRSSFAQTPEAHAEKLFNEGKEEAKRGNVAAACEKFVASHRLDPAGGTILHVADCHESEGRLASAWNEYNEALAFAIHDKRTDREVFAREHIAALTPRLGHIVLTISSEAAAVADLEIKLDGRKIDSLPAARVMPADRGKHSISASAPGKTPWSTEILVVDGVPTPTVVPALLDGPGDAGPSSASWFERHPRRTIALAVGGVGVVGLAIGTIFGLRAVTIGDQSPRCTLGPDRTGCPDAAVSDQDSARSSATISTVAFVLGGLAVGAGAVLWFTAPEAKRGNVAVGVAPSAAGGSVVIGGRL